MSLTISLTADQVVQRLEGLGLHCRFSETERQSYATIPVVETDLSVFGFPTPAENTNLTLRKIREAVGIDPRHQPAVFDHPWYQSEAFMDAPCPPGWHVLAMEPIPGSILQPGTYLRSLETRKSMLELPRATEVVLMLFLHFAASAEQLLFKKHTWCSDLASFDRQVTVGAFGRNGVFLSSHPTGFASKGLGICARLPVITSVPGTT